MFRVSESSTGEFGEQIGGPVPTPEEFTYIRLPFFEEQLTAFDVWLGMGFEERHIPDQLPVVLQVLLCQVHRVRALELLGKFLDLGWWAVNSALTVGIFPYVLRLLQSSTKELRPLLVFVWAKILAVDQTCQVDLVRDGSHKYFIDMISDTTLSIEYRTMAVFVLSNIVRAYPQGQGPTLVRQEIVVALHSFVLAFENQFISCAETNMAIESQYFGGNGGGGGAQGTDRLTSPVNLGRSGNNARMRVLLRNNTGNTMTVTGSEVYSPGAHVAGASSRGFRSGEPMRRVASFSSLSDLMNVLIPPAAEGPSSSLSMPRQQIRQRSPSMSLPASSTSSVSGVYNRVYNYLVSLEGDPYPGVSLLARTVLDHIRSKAIAKSQVDSCSTSFVATESQSSGESCTSKPGTPTGADGGSTPTRQDDDFTPAAVQSPTSETPVPCSSIPPTVSTKFTEWCWSQFSRPRGGMSIGGTRIGESYASLDPQDPSVYTRNWVYIRNAKTRRDCFKRTNNFPGKLVDQVLSKSLTEVIRNGGGSCVKFHPYENLVVVGGPGVVDSAARKLSSRDIARIGSNMMKSMVVDKSVFLVFEYDDSSHLSNYYSHQSHPESSSAAGSSSTAPCPSVPMSTHPETPTSTTTVQPRIINKTEIEHSLNSYIHISHSTPPVITSLEWINSSNSITTDISSLLATGCNDGCVRIYKPTLESPQSSLVTAWAVTSMARVNRLLMKYEHERTNLVVAYNSSRSSTLAVWDVGCERLVREIGTMDGAILEGLVSYLDCNRCESHIFVLGGEDGAVRLLDLRVPPAECVTTKWRDLHASNARVQSVRLRHDRTVVAGSANGRVRFFDLRSTSPMKTIETTMDVTAVDVHPNLPYFGIGTSSSIVSLYGFQEQTPFHSNSIRQGFGGFARSCSASNSISSVAFHDFKPFMLVDTSFPLLHTARGALKWRAKTHRVHRDSIWDPLHPNWSLSTLSASQYYNF